MLSSAHSLTIMVRRWITTASALVPVLFVPTCVATHAVLIWRAKTPVVQQQVSGEFPVLQIRDRSVEVVPYRSRDPHAVFFVPPTEQKGVAKDAEAIGPPDDERSVHAEIDFQNVRTGLERIHVNTTHELAMGFIRRESWYDCDGRSIVPRYEREYLPIITFMGACFGAIPVTLVIAGVAAPFVLSLRSRPALPIAATRAIIAVLLYAAAVAWLVGGNPFFFAGLPVVAGAAYVVSRVNWTKRRQAFALLLIFAGDISICFMLSSVVVVAVLAGELVLLAFVAAANLIHRSLRAVLG
jgi:hypothetical protein